MKNILKIAATLSLLSGAAVADPVLGVWKTTPDDNGNFGHIKVAECEGEICGTLIKSFDSTGASYKSENIGKQIIWAMKNKGDGKYGGGKIWSTDRDKVYNSKMVLEGNDQLKISGCVLILCRDGGTWTRID
jgi:uncharacterized protein (DUF2147 family)